VVRLRSFDRAARAGLACGLAALLLAGTLAGCNALIPHPWIGGWQLRTFGGQPAASLATASFSATDVVIETGCNEGAGAYTYQDPTLTLTAVAFTARACADAALAAQDAAIVAIAHGPTTMRVAGNELTIDPGSGGAVLVFDRTGGG
jgi:heat shock protein HslJ